MTKPTKTNVIWYHPSPVEAMEADMDAARIRTEGSYHSGWTKLLAYLGKIKADVSRLIRRDHDTSKAELGEN